MIIAFTGHRPGKLGGYSSTNQSELIAFIECLLIEHKPDGIISGMALGVDQAAVVAAIRRQIPFVAAIPCRGQADSWPSTSYREYQQLLKKAADKVIISELYTKTCMQDRNIWMVDHCDKLIAFWDGSTGGTKNCIMYANSIRKPVENYWTEYQKSKTPKEKR